MAIRLKTDDPGSSLRLEAAAPGDAERCQRMVSATIISATKCYAKIPLPDESRFIGGRDIPEEGLQDDILGNFLIGQLVKLAEVPFVIAGVAGAAFDFLLTKEQDRQFTQNILDKGRSDKEHLDKVERVMEKKEWQHDTGQKETMDA